MLFQILNIEVLNGAYLTNYQINEKLHKVETPASIAIADRVRDLCIQGKRIACMQTGEPSFNTPRYIVEGAYQAMLDGETHYSNSQGQPALRQAISDWYHELYSVKIPTDQIIINAGAVHSIFCIMSTLINSEDEILISEPFWPQYGYIVNLLGGEIKSIDTKSSDFKLSVDLLEKSITKKSKILILNNPCNPTGIVYTANELEAFLEVAEEHNLFVLFDEVYSQIVYSNKFSSVLSVPGYTKHTDRILYVNSL